MALDASWGGIDFGFDNDDGDSLRAFLRSYPGPIEEVRNPFAFPGVHGCWMQRLGRRVRPITWHITLLANSQSTRVDWELAIEAMAKAHETYPMSLHGRTYENVELTTFRPVTNVQGAFPYAQRCEYELLFHELMP